MEYGDIKKLIDDVGNSKLSSLEIDFPDGMKISMKKDVLENHIDETFKKIKNDFSENKKIDFENKLNITLPEKQKDDIVGENVYKYVKSPMVGTFYSKPSPDEKCFIEVGDSIKKGATTCIIEAMKLMNEIECEFDGEVVEVLKKDGDPVEFGENLIKLR